MALETFCSMQLVQSEKWGWGGVGVCVCACNLNSQGMEKTKKSPTNPATGKFG